MQGGRGDFVSDRGSRFELRTRLGRGGQGVVDLAFDHTRGRLVALKRLEDDGAAIHLKREFRAAVGVAHENLVELYELGTASGRPFFTMEYVNGRNVSHRPESDEVAGAWHNCSVQLLQALAALDAHGLVHRDIKPSNIMLETTGRVVLLDFGLSVRATLDGSRPGFGGTFRYAAPEQLTGGTASVASDMFAAGVVLFELATGELPFTALGRVPRRPPAKARFALLSDRVGLQATQVVEAMLSIDPGDRPSAAEAAHRFAALGGRRARSIQTPFVGRTDELATLDASAAEAWTAGRGRLVLIEGTAGLGKTTLVERHCSRAKAARPDLCIVRGRAQRSELVPFAGLDEIVDGLLELARARPSSEALGDAAERLATVFGRQDSRTPTEGLGDMEATAQAVDAFAGLCERLSRAYPLLVLLDDAQWLGEDALAFADAAVSVLGPSRMVVVVGFRPPTDDEVSAARPWLDQLHGRPDATKITLGPLSAADVQQAALAVLGDNDPSRAFLSGLTQDASTPIVLKQVLRLASARVASDPLPGDLEQLVHQGVRGLPDRATQHLELLCLLGAAVQEVLACAVVGEDGDASLDQLLRAQLLCRVSGAPPMVDVIHDRVRQAVLANLDERTKQARHRQLADALRPFSDMQPELLALQFEALADYEAAAPHAELAGRAAERGFAFHRAAQLYSLALRGNPGDEATARALRMARARCRAAAGRPVTAARELLLDAREDDRAACRFSAELLLGAGELAEGTDVLQRAFAALGLRWRSTFGSVLDIGVQRAWLTASGFGRGGAPRRLRKLNPARERERLDLLWTAGFAMSVYDPIRAVALQARHARLAVGTGDADAVARSLATELVLLAAGRDTRRVERLRVEVERLRDALPPGSARAHVSMDLGTAHLYQGRFADAVREYCSAATGYGEGRLSRWELSYTRTHQAYAYEYLGDYPALFRLIRRVRRALDRSEDKLGRMYLECGTGYLERLAADKPDEARALVDDCLAPFEAVDFLAKTWVTFEARVQIALYEGNGAAAVAAIEQARPKLRQVLRTRTAAAEFHRMAALAHLAAGDLDRVDHALRAWHPHRDGIGGGVWWLVSGHLARHRGDEPGARERFEQAQERLRADRMRGFAFACAAETHRAKHTDAVRRLEGLGVVNASAWLSMLGRPD